MAARKQCTKGKRIVLEGKVMISLPEIQCAIANAERETRAKRTKKRCREHHVPSLELESASEDEDEATKMSHRPIFDSIVVERC